MSGGGTIYPRVYCPGGNVFQRDIISSDTGVVVCIVPPYIVPPDNIA